MGGWGWTDALHAPDAEMNDHFGSAVAIDGSTAVVGAKDDFVDFLGQGSVYVFERAARERGAWSLVAKLVADDASPYSKFGSAVDTDAGRIVVGAPDVGLIGEDAVASDGAAYVFEHLDSGWNQVVKLVAPDVDPGGDFGVSVAIDGDTLVIGEPYADNGVGRSDRGAAHIFQRDADETWVYEATLVASDGVDDDRFGWAVAIETDLIAVTAFPATDLSHSSGWAYVFEREGGWKQIDKLEIPDAEIGDNFAEELVLDKDQVILGAPHASFIDGEGAVYVFRRR